MADPVDPHEGLRQKQVRDRAAATRDVSATGTWDDMQALIDLAMRDKSPSVRIYAAAGAADIACRGRGAAGQTPLTDAQKAQIFEWFKGADPAHNPGLLVLLASSADPRNLERLGRALRDPRNVVRAGAVAALRRMVFSSAAMDEPQIAEAVGAWLDGGKMPPEVVLELAKLIGECGWTGFEARLRKASGGGRPHVAAVVEANERIAARSLAETWEGVWASDGNDVFEIGGQGIADWFLISGGQMVKPGKKPVQMRVADGSGSIGRRPARLIHAPRGGDRGTALALQCRGFTYWKLEGKDLAAALDDLDRLEDLGDAGRPIADWLGAAEGAQAARGHAIALIRIGALAEARAVLDGLCSSSKARNDLHWWHARVAAAQGDKKVAKAALGRFLDKAGKKAAYRTEAEALLQTL